MDQSADSGDIVSQKHLPITYEDDAASLYSRIVGIALEQLEEFVPQLLSGACPRIPQDHSKAKYWRKRGRRDGQIDFRMDSKSIYDLVRALAYPYVGAHMEINGSEFKIWKVREVNVKMENIEPRKVINVDKGKVLVKCGRGAVELLKHEIEPMPAKGEYL